MKTREKQWNEKRTPAFAKCESVSNNMAGEFGVSWGIFDEYLVEEVETSRFHEILEVDLCKMREGYQKKTLRKARQHGPMF